MTCNENAFSRILCHKMLNYIVPKASIIFNSLNCTEIAAAGAPPQTTLGVPTAIQIPTIWDRNKTSMKFVNLLSHWGCLAVSQTFMKIISSRLQLPEIFYFLIIEQFSENSDFYSTKCLLFSLKCIKIVGGWYSTPDPAGELTGLPRLPSREPVMGWGYEIYRFTELLGLPGCVPDLTGSNIRPPSCDRLESRYDDTLPGFSQHPGQKS